MTEREHSPLPEMAETTANLETDIRQIYNHISEMDASGYSDLTIPLKVYLEHSGTQSHGNPDPVRVAYLEKLTNRAYVKYLQREENTVQEKNRQESDPRRVHENGECGSYEFIFNLPQDADDFAVWLDQKNREKLDGNELLPHLRNNSTLFDYSKFHLIDGTYALLDSEANFTENERQELLKKYNISQSDLEQAVADYLQILDATLKEQAEVGAEKAKENMPREAHESKVAYFGYRRESRYQSVPWDVVEKALENCEKDIITRARAIAEQKRAHPRALLTP